jgi:hypothetical protein
MKELTDILMSFIFEVTAWPPWLYAGQMCNTLFP